MEFVADSFSVWLSLQHCALQDCETSSSEYYLNRGASTLLTLREVTSPPGGPAHGAVTAVLSGLVIGHWSFCHLQSLNSTIVGMEICRPHST